MTPEREKYWNTIIAFDCPLTRKRHTINYCFENCGMFGYQYNSDGAGGAAAFLYCNMVDGERDLKTGERTRDN